MIRDHFQDRVDRVNRAMDASRAFYWRFAFGFYAVYLLYTMSLAVGTGWYLHDNVLYYIWWHSGRLYFPSLKLVILANAVSLLVVAGFVEWIAPPEERLQLLEYRSDHD